MFLSNILVIVSVNQFSLILFTERRLDSFVSSYQGQGRNLKESTRVSAEEKDTDSDVIILNDDKQDTVKTSSTKESNVTDLAGRKESVKDIHENTESSESGLESAGIRQNSAKLPDETGDHVREINGKGLKPDSEFSDRTCIFYTAKDQCVQMSAEEVQSETLCSQNNNKICVQKDNAKDQRVHDNTLCVQNDEICVQNFTDCVQENRKVLGSLNDVCVHEDRSEQSEEDLDKESHKQDLNIEKVSVEVFKVEDNFEKKIVHHRVVNKMDKSDAKLDFPVISDRDAGLADNTVEEYIVSLSLQSE